MNDEQIRHRITRLKELIIYWEDEVVKATRMAKMKRAELTRLIDEYPELARFASIDEKE